MSVHTTTMPAPSNGSNGNGKVAAAPTPAGPEHVCTCTHEEPEVESAPLGNTASRVYWQAAPCPAWCQDGGQHKNADSGSDRAHFGVSSAIWLTTGDGHVETGTKRPDGSPDIDAWRVWPDDVRAWLTQEYREIEPRVGMGYGDNTEWHLTLSEAAELRDLLTSLIDQARP